MDKLKIKRYVNYFKLTNSFKFDIFDQLSSLVYARSVHPCSKNRTFHEVLPNLYHTYDYSYGQLLDGISFLGKNYEKFIEIFTTQVKSIYGLTHQEPILTALTSILKLIEKTMHDHAVNVDSTSNKQTKLKI